MDLRVDVSQLVRFARGMAGGERAVAEEMATAMDESTRDVAGGARQLVRVRTGATQRSITPSVRRVAGGVEGRVTAGHGARWLEHGRGWVYPVRANVLSWVDAGGNRVFARRSRPAPARPFLRPALERARPRIAARFRRVAPRAFARLVRGG